MAENTNTDIGRNPNATLRKLQLEELDILRSFDSICRKNDLRYYVVGGTLIGAVRHKGFIPWDDDIDVSMPRRDFEKFLRIAKDSLPESLFLQTHKTDKECYFSYAKLRKDGTYFPEEKFEHTSVHKGIFMDIFPLDFIPSKGLSQKLIFKSAGLISGLICSKQRTTEYLYEGKSPLFVFFFRALQSILPKSLLLWLRNFIGKISEKLSDKKNLASLSGFHGYPKEVAPTDYWGDGTDIEFEGFTVKAPSQYHKLLTHMFGDYMTLPPEEERINHNINFDNVIFEGLTTKDYKPKCKKRRSFLGCEYRILPVE